MWSVRTLTCSHEAPPPDALANQRLAFEASHDWRHWAPIVSLLASKVAVVVVVAAAAAPLGAADGC